VRVQAPDGLTITLDEDHWRSHIVANHPELAEHWDNVIEAVRSPDGVFQSKRDQGTRIYFKTFSMVTISGSVFERMPLLVCVRERGGFVVSAYFGAARSLGKRVWPS
jgi:hypothetical protein